MYIGLRRVFDFFRLQFWVGVIGFFFRLRVGLYKTDSKMEKARRDEGVCGVFLP